MPQGFVAQERKNPIQRDDFTKPSALSSNREYGNQHQSGEVNLM